MNKTIHVPSENPVWLNTMCGAVAKAADVRDTGSIPGMGRSPEERNGNPV